MSTYQSTNPVPEHEAFQINDDHDELEHLTESGPHIIRVEAFRIEHATHTRRIYYICPICNHQHHHGLDWEYGPLGYIERSRHCLNKQQLQNMVLQISLPQGYKDHWHHGLARPGTDYPTPMVADTTKDYEPREHGPCPTGCIKDHTRDDMTEEHYSIMRTNIAEPDNAETSRLMIRTQQFLINTDPADVQRWIEIQIHDLDAKQWQGFDLSTAQASQLADYLNFMVEGADTLESILPTIIDYRDGRKIFRRRATSEATND